MSDYRKVEVIIVLVGIGDSMTTDPEGLIKTIRKEILIDIDMPLEDLRDVFEGAIGHIEDEN